MNKMIQAMPHSLRVIAHPLLLLYFYSQSVTLLLFMTIPKSSLFLVYKIVYFLSHSIEWLEGRMGLSSTSIFFFFFGDSYLMMFIYYLQFQPTKFVAFQPPT